VSGHCFDFWAYDIPSLEIHQKSELVKIKYTWRSWKVHWKSRNLRFCGKSTAWMYQIPVAGSVADGERQRFHMSRKPKSAQGTTISPASTYRYPFAAATRLPTRGRPRQIVQ
jgi:hypothetical protein